MNTQSTEPSLEQKLLLSKNIQDLLIKNAKADLERKLVSQETADFQRSITPQHSLFAVTLTPELAHLIKYRLTRSQSDCSSYVHQLVTELLHLFHKNCNNNYSRYESKLTRFFAPVEFEDKHHSEPVTPHTHSCFAVHPDYLEMFESLLTQHPTPSSKRTTEEQLTINFARLKSPQKASFLKSRVNSIHITRLKRADFFAYAAYCFKEQSHSLKLREKR